MDEKIVFIERANNLCRIVPPTIIEPDVHDKLSFVIEGSWFSKQYRSGRWDGKKRLLNKRTRCFPTGFLDDVVKEYQRLNYRVQVDNLVLYEPIIHDYKINTIEDRYYQDETMKEIIKKKRGVVKYGTGGGKTSIMAMTIKAFNERALILVHKKALFYQIQKDIKKMLGIKIGLAGDSGVDLQNVTVGMIQTLNNIINIEEFKEWFDGVKILMGDEIHHASAKSWYNIMLESNAPIRIGFSATPLSRGKGPAMMLKGVTGELLYDKPGKELADEGYLAQPHIYVTKIKEGYNSNFLSKAERTIMKPSQVYRKVYDLGIVKNTYRNGIIKKIVYNNTHLAPILILVERVVHGEILAQMIGCPFIYGKTDQQHIDYILNSVRKGDIKILVASTILDEGINIPNIRTVIPAGNRKSELKTIQRLGRGMRKKEGSNKLVVFEFMDYTDNYLLKHSSKRIKTYKSEGYNVYEHNPDSTITCN